MRLSLLSAFALACLAFPAAAQTISPMTGTTAAPPQLSPAPGAATAPAAPARPARQTMQQRFEAANTTKDGKLTLEQARAAKMQRVVKNFAAMDTAKKGYVTVDDITAFNRAQRSAHRPAQ